MQIQVLFDRLHFLDKIRTWQHSLFSLSPYHFPLALSHGTQTSSLCSHLLNHLTSTSMCTPAPSSLICSQYIILPVAIVLFQILSISCYYILAILPTYSWFPVPVPVILHLCLDLLPVPDLYYPSGVFCINIQTVSNI